MSVCRRGGLSEKRQRQTETETAHTRVFHVRGPVLLKFE